MIRRSTFSRKKYGNRTTRGLDGYNYHSALEASVANMLRLMEKAGEIELLSRQQHIHFYSAGVKLCEYWPDFTIIDKKTGAISWCEAKGFSDKPEWKIKFNLWRAGGPGLLQVYGGTWQSPKLIDRVFPEIPNSLVRDQQVFGKLRGEV